MSTLNVSNITDGTTTVGTSYVVNGSAKAWARFDADGSLDASLNISSASDEGTGSTQVNYTSNFNSGGDCVVTGMTQNNTDYGFSSIQGGSFRGLVRLLSSQAAYDRENTMIHVMGDLA